MTGLRTPLEIRSGGVADRHEIVTTLAEAFHNGALAEWLMPGEPALRRLAYRQYAHVLFDLAIIGGRVEFDVTPGAYGAAVWVDYSNLERDHGLTGPGRFRGAMAQAVGEQVADRFIDLRRVIASNAPTEPHHHLAFLGVSPSHQRTGIATALLRHRHARLDATGMAAFVVATSEHGRELFGRDGYTVRQPIALANGPTLWPMWRAPITGARP